MRVVFFGTPPFAADLLTHLIACNVQVVGVVSRPDKPQGRFRHEIFGAVKLVAEAHHLPHFQPEKVASILPQLAALQPDLFIVVAYGEILTQAVLDLPKIACINVHASLLPKYRGAAPIQRPIIEGAKETGITIMHMVRKMDAGAIILQERMTIENNTTYGELELEMRKVASHLLLKAIDLLEKGLAPRIPQEESAATYAPKMELEDCQVDFNLPSAPLHNLVRGTNPEPGAWCKIWIDGQEKRLKIFHTALRDEVMIPQGEAVLDAKNQLLVGCGQGTLELQEVQLEGKKRMKGADFYRGLPKGRWKIHS